MRNAELLGNTYTYSLPAFVISSVGAPFACIILSILLLFYFTCTKLPYFIILICKSVTLILLVGLRKAYHANHSGRWNENPGRNYFTRQVSFCSTCCFS